MTVSVRRAYGELDRAEVLGALRRLACRVGVQRVTMRELASELGASVPSVYYHVPGKAAALDLLAESVLADIPEPGAGQWDSRLIELYCAARGVLLGVSGIAVILQSSGDGESARRLDRLSRDLLSQSGLGRDVVAPAHTVLYTYLLGSVSLEESRPETTPRNRKRLNALRFRAGLEVIVCGIRAKGEQS